MNPPTRRVRSGKMVRYGTAFTGTACALAFAPAAAVAATPQPGHQQPHRGYTPEAPLTITHKSGCPRGTSTWYHEGNETGSICFGGSGTSYLRTTYTEYCGGNNYGWIKVGNPFNGVTSRIHFHQGTTYAHIPAGYSSIRAVHISGWSGTDGCPRV